MQRAAGSICLRCRIFATPGLTAQNPRTAPPTTRSCRNGIRQIGRTIVTASRWRALRYSSPLWIGERGDVAAVTPSTAWPVFGLRNASSDNVKGSRLSDDWFEKNGIANWDGCGVVREGRESGEAGGVRNGEGKITTTSNLGSSASRDCEQSISDYTYTTPGIANQPSSAPPSSVSNIFPEEENSLKAPLQTTTSDPNGGGPSEKTDHEPPSARTIQLGRTIRALQTHLPTILQSPLPSNILSPQVTLHLFPSTHPHLPVAKGKVAYKTALWTSPFVWGQIPGRAKVVILSERIIKPCEQGEQLIVRWRTDTSNSSSASSNDASSSSNSSSSTTDSVSKDISEKYITPTTAATPQQLTEEGYSRIFKSSYSPSSTSTSSPGTPNKDFTGLFLFTFDSNGLLAKHTIEHADENFTSNYEQNAGVGGKVIGVTEWLLKKAKRAAEREKKEEGGVIGTPGLAWLRVGMQERTKSRSREK